MSMPKEDDKSSWGDGPWVSEPDQKKWTDEATGLPCIAFRNQYSGHWCGYVGIDPTHPWHGEHYDAISVEVHGGLTYSEKCRGTICHTPKPGESDNIWWFGFDCAHFGVGDVSPMTEAFRKTVLKYEIAATYKTLSYVEEECASLAMQLKLASTASVEDLTKPFKA